MNGKGKSYFVFSLLGNLVIEKVPPQAPHPPNMMVGQQMSPGHNVAGKHTGQINLAQLRLQHMQQAAFAQKQQHQHQQHHQQQHQHQHQQQQQHQQQMQQQMRIASQMSQHPRQGGPAQMMQQQVSCVCMCVWLSVLRTVRFTIN